MLLVVDEPLRWLLATGARIASTWPQSNEDVRLLLKLVQVTIPSLAEVLATGLVVLTVVNAAGSIVTLTLGDVFLVAIAHDQDGHRVRDPGSNPERVVRLDVVDVHAEGRSGVEVTR